VCLGTASFDTIQVNSSLSIGQKTHVTAAPPCLSCSVLSQSVDAASALSWFVVPVCGCYGAYRYVVVTVRTMQACRRNIGVARFDVDLCSTFRWVVSFTLRPLCPYCGHYCRFGRLVETSLVSAASKGDWESDVGFCTLEITGRARAQLGALKHLRF